MKRAKSSMMNMGAGIIGQSLALVVSYIARRVFLDVLNADYLGVNNLFTNILSMLSLVEIGIGPAIVYSLYKPLAEHDTAKVKVLMKLFAGGYRLTSYDGVRSCDSQGAYGSSFLFHCQPLYGDAW